MKTDPEFTEPSDMVLMLHAKAHMRRYTMDFVWFGGMAVLLWFAACTVGVQSFAAWIVAAVAAFMSVRATISGLLVLSGRYVIRKWDREYRK